MDCREAQDLLSEFQDGALPSAEAEAVGAHLRECRECAGTHRSLAAVREGLRRIPPVPAPPGLMERVREAIAREGGGAAPGSPGSASPPRGRSLLSRVRLPLEAAAAVLLVASIWWYQKGGPPSPVPPATPSPTEISAPPPAQDPDSGSRRSGKTATPAKREPRIARQSDGTSSPAGSPKPAPEAPAASSAGKPEIAFLPPGAPEPKARAWSPADLPAAPAVRASSESIRIVAAEPEPKGGALPGTLRDAAPAPAPKVLAAPPSRLLSPLPYGREILLDVTPEGRGGAAERIADAARRSGGSVERVERDLSGETVVAVRVLLPEPSAANFLSELDRIGKVPPEGKPAEVDIPAGPTRGTVAYTVRIRVR